MKGFTRASTLGPIADVIAGAGGSPRQVFARADLPLALQQTPEVFVPLKDHFNLLQHAAMELSDELFAARLGQQVTVLDLGTYGKWVVQAPTLLEALRRANASLGHLLQSATELRVRIDRTDVTWSYDSKDPACEGRQHNELLALCFMVAIARAYLGSAWVPDRVVVGGRPLGDSSGLEQLLGTNVAFHDGPGALVFDRKLLAATRLRPGGASLDLSELGAAIDVPNPDDLHDIVGALIDLELTERLPTIDWAASKLGMSERTLQRKLGETGARFSSLVQSAVQLRAFQLLRRSSQSITDVAIAVGYSDAAHFARAFKRWTGMTPQQWRDYTMATDPGPRS